jgi:hypothetical protein
MVYRAFEVGQFRNSLKIRISIFSKFICSTQGGIDNDLKNQLLCTHVFQIIRQT